ncbi:MAG TPA: ABC transporter substrate-binding protein [Streptosporangiaceae bacterium]|jgi:multiple sugar transport system substrate-binding protein|nr:ABC transporter substrate-binding protein [Streptosporangiaceae bacterium]
MTGHGGGWPSSLRNRSLRRRAAMLSAPVLLTAALAACSSASAANAPVTLNYWSFPDNSGAIQQAVNNCSAASDGKYTIVYNKLPTDADGQRQQIVRRLAAHDSSMDILGLDVTWEAETAQAGWILPWTGADKAAAEKDTLPTMLQTATWNGQLYAVPYNTNTQLLWYRSDLVPNPPTTWDQMISDAERLAREGKPHYIEIQGAQYEGVTVWFNSLVASAGGSILNAGSTAPSLGAPAMKALQIMSRLAHSPAADPSLSVQQEDQNRLAMEGGTAAFELNYPFVYPSMQTDNPQLFKHFKWALYPRVYPNVPSHVTIGGIDLAVSAYSAHPALARQAILCLRDRPNQILAAVKGGLPPTLMSLYDDPSFIKAYPFAAAIKQALLSASVRPKTPYYQNVSIVISHAVSPPADINPASTLAAIQDGINNALADKGLVP